MRKKVYLCISTKSYKNETINQRAKIRNIFVFERRQDTKNDRRSDRVSKSTISREVRRNSGVRGYTFRQAQEWADIRKERLRLPRKMNAEIIQRIEKLMRAEDWSPEQIEGWCAVKGYRMVSKSSIYEYIHKDKEQEQGGDLYKHCRFQLKHRRKPVGKYMPIKNRVGIEKRPVEADGTRLGDGLDGGCRRQGSDGHIGGKVNLLLYDQEPAAGQERKRRRRCRH